MEFKMKQPTRVTPAPKRHQRGFTLIELMIVVAVVGILSAIAYPNYAEYVLRSHRSKAKSALQQAAQWMERAATAQGAYPVTANVPSGVLTVEGGRYTMTVNSDATTYTLTTTPGTNQAADKCGTMTLTNTGARTVSGSLSTDECWAK